MSDHSLSAEDRVEIMDLLARYSRSLDAKDIDSWLTIWHRDAVLESSQGTVSQADGLRGWATRLFDERGVGADPARVIHFLGLPLINGAGDHATGQTYTIIANADDDGDVGISLLGRYDDEYVREDGRWWIVRRKINGVLRRTSK